MAVVKTKITISVSKLTVCVFEMAVFAPVKKTAEPTAKKAPAKKAKKKPAAKTSKNKLAVSNKSSELASKIQTKPVLIRTTQYKPRTFG